MEKLVCVENYNWLSRGSLIILGYDDTRSVYPGGVNSDFYFIACLGIASGNYPEKPTGIFRIKKSCEEIDPAYFVNISASAIKDHGYGFGIQETAKPSSEPSATGFTQV